MTVDTKKLESVLADPKWTREVVAAAARSLNALETADAAGRTPDGDHADMVARTNLSTAFVDAAAIRSFRA